ncbi:MAG: hypothetical protein GY714_07230 [Desulfobacterales bacterium]|nr:hypothetical protein [Desulfobacterales bacterium]
MENISRIVDKELLKGLTLKSKKRTQNWDMFFIADDGQMFVIKKFKWFLRICIFLFIAMLISLSVCIFLLVKSELSRSSYQDHLTVANKKISELRNAKELLQAEKEIMLANRNTYDKTLTEADKETKDVTVEVEKKPVVLESPITAGKVFISRRSDSNIYKIRFRLTNQTNNEKAVNGYVFMILKKVDGTIDRVIPQVSLINEKPSEYRKGQYFSINRFKTVRFNFNRKTPPDAYKECSVLAYSLEGKLLLENRSTIRVNLLTPPVVKNKPVNEAKKDKVDSVINKNQEDINDVKPEKKQVKEKGPEPG